MRSQPASNLIFACACAVASASAGCSGQSNFLTGGPTVGQLKTSLLGMSFLNRLQSWQVNGDRLVLQGYP